LQGRQFHIEYATSDTPDGYPIPLHSTASDDAYPEPVVIDTLPTNIIQHVKTSNNPALVAALDAAIDKEQHVPSLEPQHSGVASFNVPSSTVLHHAEHNEQHVQQSRPVSSSESDSSSGTSSSSSGEDDEETDSEESGAALSSKVDNVVAGRHSCVLIDFSSRHWRARQRSGRFHRPDAREQSVSLRRNTCARVV
jgi:hypothetical protein